MNLLHVKLASLIVHVEEYLSDDGRPVDRLAIITALEDPDIIEFLRSIDPVMLPVKRKKT